MIVSAPNPALSQTDAALHMIEEMIVTLQLQPGVKVTEKSLADLTGFGRTPVREALLRLVQGFLVEILPRNGILITPIDFDVILMTLEVRRQLEHLIVDRAARYANDRERRRMLALIPVFGQAADSGDALGFIRADDALNALLNSAAGHLVASKLVHPLHSVSRRMGFALGRIGGQGFDVTGPLHQQLIQAVVEGNSSASLQAQNTLLDGVEELARRCILEGIKING